MKQTTIAAMAGLLLVTPAMADEWSFTGNQLYESCHESRYDCATFAAGVMAGMFIGKMNTLAARQVCLPNQTLTFGQLSNVITKYLRNHPEQRHEPAFLLVGLAISDAWPDACIDPLWGFPR